MRGSVYARLFSIFLALSLPGTACVRYEHAVRFSDPARHVRVSGDVDGRELVAPAPYCSLRARMTTAGSTGTPTHAFGAEASEPAKVGALAAAARAFGREVVFEQSCAGSEGKSGSVQTPGTNIEKVYVRDHLARGLAAFPVILAGLTLAFCVPMIAGAFDKTPSDTLPEGKSYRSGGIACTAVAGAVLAGSLGVMMWDPVSERRLDEGSP